MLSRDGLSPPPEYPAVCGAAARSVWPNCPTGSEAVGFGFTWFGEDSGPCGPQGKLPTPPTFRVYSVPTRRGSILPSQVVLQATQMSQPLIPTAGHVIVLPFHSADLSFSASLETKVSARHRLSRSPDRWYSTASEILPVSPGTGTAQNPPACRASPLSLPRQSLGKAHAAMEFFPAQSSIRVLSIFRRPAKPPAALSPTLKRSPSIQASRPFRHTRRSVSAPASPDACRM